MKAIARTLPGASKRLNHLANAVWRRGHVREARDLVATADAGQRAERYGTILFQSLAIFRFLSFALGTGLVFVINLGVEPTLVPLLVLGLVGFYNVMRVLWRFEAARYGPAVRWLSVGSDLVLSVALVVVTGGLDSAFLIYSVAPILTASLLLDSRMATAVAALSVLSVTGAHVAATLGLNDFPRIQDGNYVAFALLYAAVALLVAYLPFLANLNWQRRMRAQSVAVERQRLRREVHDNIAQTLAFLSLKVRRAEERASASASPISKKDVGDVARVVERAYLAVRDYLDGTEPGESDEPLATSLATVAREWSRQTSLPVTNSAKGTEPGLPPGAKLHLLQIAREALANVAKHASPKQVWVELECNPAQVTLRVRDDGRGLPADHPRGHGMDIMSERASMIGGSVSVSSAPGRGTEVVVVCPDEVNKEEA